MRTNSLAWPGADRAAGFTLMEILLAIAILAILLGAAYATLLTTLSAEAQVVESLAAERIGTRILGILRSDLEAVRIYRMKEPTFVAMEIRVPEPSTREIHFLSATRSFLPDDDRYSPLTEVGYALEPGAAEGFYSLHRREDFFVDKDPTGGGSRILLHDMVAKFLLTFHGDPKKPPRRDWEVSDDLGFPLRVDVELGIAIQVLGKPKRRSPTDYPLHQFATTIALRSQEREKKKKDSEESEKSEDGKDGKDGKEEGGSEKTDEVVEEGG